LGTFSKIRAKHLKHALGSQLGAAGAAIVSALTLLHQLTGWLRFTAKLYDFGHSIYPSGFHAEGRITLVPVDFTLWKFTCTTTGLWRVDKISGFYDLFRPVTAASRFG